MGAAISTISSNLPEMAKGVKLISALMEQDEHDDRLLDATRRLCNAFSDLLNAAQPENKEVRLFLEWALVRSMSVGVFNVTSRLCVVVLSSSSISCPS